MSPYTVALYPGLYLTKRYILVVSGKYDQEYPWYDELCGWVLFYTRGLSMRFVNLNTSFP